ncbi:MAG: hypothetical protein U0V74_16635 [Chitinophagales bacterium]
MMTWERMQYLFPVLGFMVMIYFGFIYNPECANENRTRSHYWHGIVIKKFVDSNEHMSETIILMEADSSKQELYLKNDFSKFFNLVQIGDKVLKQKGSTTVIIFRNGEKLKPILLDYRCNPR